MQSRLRAQGSTIAMPEWEPSIILLSLLLMMSAVVVAAIVMAWSWLIWSAVTGQAILPQNVSVQRGEPPWRLGSVLAVILACATVSLAISAGYRLTTGRNDAQGKSSGTEMMLLNCLLDLALLVVIPYLVRKTSGARLRDFGVDFVNWPGQVACGLVATLITAPLVYAIQYGVVRIWDPKAHPLMTAVFEEFSVGVAALAVVTAVIVAPIFEELLFRGLLQSWLVGVLDRSAAAAPSMAALLKGESVLAPELSAPPAESWASEPGGVSSAPLATLPPPQLGHSSRRWLAIVLTSVLFAYVHSPQWPAPIPLFALALVIGTVYYQTSSLIAAVSMHATFNGISTLMLFIAVLTGRDVGAEKAPINVTGEIRQRFDEEGRRPLHACPCIHSVEK
jgi:membrane protease YdiL (CAAX protease family)